MPDKMSFSDIRSVKTYNSIISTFKDMVRHMNADEITVTDITGQAGISRKTFYAYFETRESIFTALCDEILKRFEKHIDKIIHLETFDYYENVRIFFRFFANEDVYTEQILCNPTYIIYREYIIEKTSNYYHEYREPFTYLEDEDRILFQNYAFDHLFSIYRHWVGIGKTIPIEKVIDFSYKMLFYGISWIEQNKKANGKPSE